MADEDLASIAHSEYRAPHLPAKEGCPQSLTGSLASAACDSGCRCMTRLVRTGLTHRCHLCMTLMMVLALLERLVSEGLRTREGEH
jgi:hypothetical protein